MIDETIEADRRTHSVVSRRTLLAAGSTVLAAAAATTLPGLVPHANAAAADAPNAALVRTALECAGTGELCLHHCFTEFAKGQTMLAQCAARVAEMVPVCQGLASLASLESKYLKAYARVCIDVCQACEDECRKHANHAAICGDCADSCAKVIAALKALPA